MMRAVVLVLTAASARALDLRPQKATHRWPRLDRAFGKSLANLGAAATIACGAPLPSLGMQDNAAVGRCVVSQCSLPLAKCVASPKCLANLVCINTCVGKADEHATCVQQGWTECQIRCGDLFENEVAAEFNACAVSSKGCVPQRQNDGSYPEPPAESLVSSFDTKLFDGRWFISAGRNPIFDVFDCQVHYFNAPAPGKLVGKLNWRIEEPDGEQFNKQAVQTFIQDPKQPGILYNHDNEYLHYQDDWYILDYENKASTPENDKFVLVYYRGRNDAWDGYGGAVLYTKARTVSPAVAEKAAAACERAGLDFSQFKQPDNSCKELSESERNALRQKYASGMLLTAEQELQEEVTNLRRVAASTISSDLKGLEKSTASIEKLVLDFEKEIEKDIVEVEKEIARPFQRR